LNDNKDSPILKKTQYNNCAIIGNKTCEGFGMSIALKNKRWHANYLESVLDHNNLLLIKKRIVSVTYRINLFINPFIGGALCRPSGIKLKHPVLNADAARLHICLPRKSKKDTEM